MKLPRILLHLAEFISIEVWRSKEALVPLAQDQALVFHVVYVLFPLLLLAFLKVIPLLLPNIL